MGSKGHERAQETLLRDFSGAPGASRAAECNEIRRAAPSKTNSGQKLPRPRVFYDVPARAATAKDLEFVSGAPKTNLFG